MKVLSPAGRITLANSVITSLPMYQIQSSRFPSSVAKEMDKLVRKCIRVVMITKRRSTLSFGMNYVNRKKEGGLGVRRAKDMNKPMLGRLGWRLLDEQEAL